MGDQGTCHCVETPAGQDCRMCLKDQETGVALVMHCSVTTLCRCHLNHRNHCPANAVSACNVRLLERLQRRGVFKLHRALDAGRVDCKTAMTSSSCCRLINPRSSRCADTCNVRKFDFRRQSEAVQCCLHTSAKRMLSSRVEFTASQGMHS